MKKQILSFSLVLLALTAITGNASAQGNDRRVDAARFAADEGRTYRTDHWDRGDGDRRAADDLDRLNREVRAARSVIEDSRHAGRRVRDRFGRVLQATDYLNDQFRRGNVGGGEVPRRVEEIRRDLERVRRDLRGGHIGIGW